MFSGKRLNLLRRFMSVMSLCVLLFAIVPSAPVHAAAQTVRFNFNNPLTETMRLDGSGSVNGVSFEVHFSDGTGLGSSASGNLPYSFDWSYPTGYKNVSYILVTYDDATQYVSSVTIGGTTVTNPYPDKRPPNPTPSTGTSISLVRGENVISQKVFIVNYDNSRSVNTSDLLPYDYSGVSKI